MQSTPPQPPQPSPSHPPHPVSPGPAHAAPLPTAEASPSVCASVMSLRPSPPAHQCVSHVLPQAASAPRPRPLPAPVPHAPVSVGPGEGSGAMLRAVVKCALVPATPCNQHHHSPRNRARRTPLTPSVLARRTPPGCPPLKPAAASRVQAAFSVFLLSLPHNNIIYKYPYLHPIIFKYPYLHPYLRPFLRPPISLFLKPSKSSKAYNIIML